MRRYPLFDGFPMWSGLSSRRAIAESRAKFR